MQDFKALIDLSLEIWKSVKGQKKFADLKQFHLLAQFSNPKGLRTLLAYWYWYQKMVGFTLKKKEDTKKPGFSGFKLKKGTSDLSQKPKKPFGFANEKDDEVKEQKIDTFDSNEGGAFNKEEGPVAKDGPLVIKNEGNGNWRLKAQQRFNPGSQQITQEVNSAKLEYGINYLENPNNGQTERKESSEVPPKINLLSQDQESLSFKADVKTRPEMSTLEDYERIPVENFGAAMLRGMGWKGDDQEEKKDGKKKAVIPVAQRTLYLGLGAKDDNEESGLKPIDKNYVPVRRINRKTGEFARGEEESRSSSRSRERSPRGPDSSNSYRSRN